MGPPTAPLPSDAPAAPAWFAELSPRPGPPWLSMGTHGLGGAGLLLVDELRPAYLREKERVLAEARHVVSVALPDGADAAAEAADLVATEGRFALPADDPRPLEAAARQVQEDLAVVVHLDGAWRLVAAVVCFPSHWSPADKLGLPLAQVHGPVPHYADELADRVDRFLDRLGPGKAVWRRNWLLHPSSELHVPEPAAADHPAPPDGLWLRSERQVLWRLPRTGGVLFSIRTQQVPLAAVSRRPALAASMAETIRSSSPALRAYRANGVDLDALVDRLDAWSGAAGVEESPPV